MNNPRDAAWAAPISGRKIGHASVFCLYAILSMALFGRGINSGNFFNPSADPFAYTWFLNWWPYALTHGINPFFTHYVWNPVGFNMMWAQSVPTLAILAAPLTLVFGAVTTWNVLMIGAPALNAFAAFLLIRYITKDVRASLAGGFIFGFSPYVVGQMLGHLSLSFVAMIPVMVLLALRRANRDIGRVRFIGLFGLCAAMQFGVSSEVLATAAAIGALAFVAFYVPYRNIADMSGLVLDIIAAGALAMILAAPGLYYAYRGLDTLPKQLYSPAVFSSDTLAFIVPTPLITLGGAHFEHVSGRFPGNYSEQGAYIGVPLLVALACSLFVKRRWVAPAVFVLACAAAFSLGPVLWINGQQTTTLLPWSAMTDVPFIKHALPARFSLYTSLVVAVLIGMWLARGGGISTAKYVLVIAGIVAIFPSRAFYGFGEARTPEAFELAVSDMQTTGSVVVLPYGYLGNSMLWQVQSGMQFKMAGGYVGFTPPYFWTFPAAMYMYGENLPQPMDLFTAQMLHFCHANNITKIAITPGTSKRLIEHLSLLHWPTRNFGDVSVISVPTAN